MREDKPTFLKQARAVLAEFLKYARPYRTWITIAIIAQIAASLLSVIVPLYYKRFFDILVGDTVLSDMSRVLISILVSILLLSLLRWVAYQVAVVSTVYSTAATLRNLESRAFAYMLHHSQSFFSDVPTGAIIARLSRLSRAYDRLVDNMVFNVTNVLILFSGILIVLSLRSMWLGLGAFAWLVLVVIIQFGASRYKQPYNLERAEADSNVTAHVADAIAGHETVRTYANMGIETARLDSRLDRLKQLRVFTWTFDSVVWASWQLLAIILEFGLMGIAVYLWSQNALTVGDFALIQAYVIVLIQNIYQLSHIIQSIFNDIGEGHEAVVMLNTPHEVRDPVVVRPLVLTEGVVEFRDVSFGYNPTRAILENFNLKIEGHEKVAFVGPSGSGKSTITKILLRLYDIEDGKILIDGTNIIRVKQDDLRSQVALVPQDPILFHRSLMENIRYGRFDANDDEVIRAAKQAHAHEFIEALSDGYDTLVGERGIKLSGGERQRVAIARAILKNAPILVLDEATSSLDSESEHYIQDALSCLMEGKTVIVIAHRLSTIMAMDRIVVMKEGKLVDQGTHAELLERDGLYQKLWSMQAGGFIPDEDAS